MYEPWFLQVGKGEGGGLVLKPKPRFNTRIDPWWVSGNPRYIEWRGTILDSYVIRMEGTILGILNNMTKYRTNKILLADGFRYLSSHTAIKAIGGLNLPGGGGVSPHLGKNIKRVKIAGLLGFGGSDWRRFRLMH